MKMLQYVVGLLLLMIPRLLLERLLSNKDQLKPRYYFSGRVAIYRTALALKNRANIAIVPEYICNVVHRAFLEAGYTLINYKCDDDFEPDIFELVEIGRRHPNSILCLAPLYGADGGESWVSSVDGQKWRKENNIFLMFDICQDFSRVYKNKLSKESMFALVSSFNNKSFPGLMGAMVVSDIVDDAYRPSNVYEINGILKLLIFDFLEYFWLGFLNIFCIKRKRFNEINHYDYSYCRQFPFDFSYYGAAKIQLAIALSGRLFLRFYTARKRNYIRRNLIAPKKTPHYLSAAIVISNGANQKLILKAPYASHGTPDLCIKPNLRSYYFRGFDDLL